jgi:hypothetical protein
MESVPALDALSSLITPEVAAELAGAYTDRPVFPESVVIDRPEDPDRSFPGWPAPVLVISYENQAVCAWGVPLDDPASPVLVGGWVDNTERTVVHAPDVAGFIAARRWDRACLQREPLLQAQSKPLDDVALSHLRANFDEQPPTFGFPGATQHRFERDGVRVLLWSGTDQCDWWLSATGPAALGEAVAGLLELSDLRESLWSNDSGGDALLDRVRAGGHDGA